MFKLLLMRHGESTGNREHRMMGHLQDGLTHQGAVQCQRLGQRLAQAGHWPSHIYSSPLRRAIASLAQILEPSPWRLPPDLLTSAGAPTGTYACQPAPQAPAVLQPLPLTVSAALMEFDAGILTGLTWPEAQQQYPELCQQLATELDWVPIPEAETPMQGRDRAAQLINDLLTTHRNEETVWVLSHHWILEHLIASLLGCDRTWQLTIPHTAIFEFWLDRDRWSDPGIALGISSHWQIKKFSDVVHLSKVPVVKQSLINLNDGIC